MARLKTKWQTEMAAWTARRLDDLEAVYLWVDGVYVKAGLEDREAAVLVLLAGLSDGRKVLLALRSGQRESDAGELIDQDWEQVVTFYGLPEEPWGHLRTTNPVESPFAALRLRTAAA